MPNSVPEIDRQQESPDGNESTTARFESRFIDADARIGFAHDAKGFTLLGLSLGSLMLMQEPKKT